MFEEAVAVKTFVKIASVMENDNDVKNAVYQCSGINP